jgi:hypothetical protein
LDEKGGRVVDGFLLLSGKIKGVSCQFLYGSEVDVGYIEPEIELDEAKSYFAGLVFGIFIKIGTGMY